MIPYNPSSFDRNKTILEQILELKNWLKEHPSYKVYQCFANYMPNQFTSYSFGQLAGDIQTIEAMAVGDVVFFADSYYAVVTAVDLDNQDFDIQSAVSFKGPQGVQGPAGADGQNGTDGTCIRYCNHNKNLNPNTTYAITDITFSTGLQVNDCILFKNNLIGFVDNISGGTFRVNGNIRIDGKDGAYISNAQIDSNGDLIITIYDPETMISSSDNVGHVVGPAGSGIQIVALTSTSGTLSADDLSKVTGTDDCIITYANAGSTLVFKRAIIDSSNAYFTNVVVDNDTYYLYCEVDVTTGAYNLGTNQLPIKASNIDSGSATSGQVLQADGNGGASWQNASGGGLNRYTQYISNWIGSEWNQVKNIILNAKNVFIWLTGPFGRLVVLQPTYFSSSTTTFKFLGSGCNNSNEWINFRLDLNTSSRTMAIHTYTIDTTGTITYTTSSSNENMTFVYLNDSPIT